MYTSVNLDKVAKNPHSPSPPLPPPSLPTSHLHLLRTEPKTLIPIPNLIPILSFPPKKGFPPSSLLPPSIPFIPSASPHPFLSLSLSLPLSHPFLTKIPHQKLPSLLIVFAFWFGSGVEWSLDIRPRGHGHGSGRGPLCGRKFVTCLKVFVVF